MSINNTTLGGKFGWEKVTTTAQKQPLGTLMTFRDGRAFRYAKAGEAISAGQLCMQTDVTSASHDTDLAVTATALAATTVNVTLAGTGIAANVFAEGWLYVNDEGAASAGQGMVYRVKSHPAATTTEAIDITLDEEDGIAGEALTTASQVGLRQNEWAAVEIWDANDIDGIPVGVAPVNVASGSYFWAQVHGPACCLFDSDDNGVNGRSVIPSISVDGALRGFDLAATSATPNDIVGYAMVASVDTESTLVFLKIE